MKLAQALILPLAGLTSAIDVYFHTSSVTCGGASLVYSNANPDQCVDGPANTESIAWRGIPAGWNVETNTFAALGCGGLRDKSDESRGRNYVCLDLGDEGVQSANYRFPGQSVKREKGKAEEGCAKPDRFVTADGAEFQISELTEEEVTKLIKLTEEGAKLPEFYESLRQ